MLSEKSLLNVPLGMEVALIFLMHSCYRNGNAAIHCAALWGRSSCIDCIGNKPGVDVNILDE